MNYYKARQLESGGWHYTCKNDGVIWPAGYCGGHEGHPTKEEAEACYRQYQLDQELRLDVRIRSVRPCEVCGAWTSAHAQIGAALWPLCDEHRTREHVEQLYEGPGEIWSS